MGTQPYKIDGKRVPSVTTVISNCKIGGIEPLLFWANRCGLEGKNHREVSDKAADAGTCAHAMIEADIRGLIFDDEPYYDETIRLAEHCFESYLKWKQQTNLTLIGSEVSLISEKYKYGGTLDAMATNQGLVLGDWKTSGGVYPDHLIQLSAYEQLWNENNPDNPVTGGAILLRIGRPDHPDDPVSFHHHYWDNLSVAFETFLKMREIYDLHKRLKSFC